MDALAYLTSIERRAQAAIDNAVALQAEVRHVRTLYLETKEPAPRSGDYPLQCGHCRSLAFLAPAGAGRFTVPPHGWRFVFGNGWRCPDCPE